MIGNEQFITGHEGAGGVAMPVLGAAIGFQRRNVSAGGLVNGDAAGEVAGGVMTAASPRWRCCRPLPCAPAQSKFQTLARGGDVQMSGALNACPVRIPPLSGGRVRT